MSFTHRRKLTKEYWIAFCAFVLSVVVFAGCMSLSADAKIASNKENTYNVATN